MFSSCLLVLASLAGLVSAAAPSVDGCPNGAGFSSPVAYGSGTAPQSFEVGQPLNIKWSQPWAESKLGFIGADNNTFLFFDNPQGTGPLNFLWTVNVNNSGEVNDNNYYMYIEDTSDSNNYCWSALWTADIPADDDQITTTATPTTISTTVGNSPTTIVVTPVITTSPTATANPNISPSPESSPTQTAAASSDNGGLSSGAKAGIGVGVALGVIAIAGAIGAFFFFRRKKYSAVATNPETGYNGGEMAMAGGSGAAAGAAGAGVLSNKQHGHSEFYGGESAQQGIMKQPAGPQEMPAPQVVNVPRHEMPGDSTMPSTSGPMGRSVYEMGDSRH